MMALLRWPSGSLRSMASSSRSAQDAALRAGTHAQVVERGRKLLELRQSHVAGVEPFGIQKLHQLQHVALIGVEGVARHVALQLQVAQVVLQNIGALRRHLLGKVSTFPSFGQVFFR